MTDEQKWLKANPLRHWRERQRDTEHPEGLTQAFVARQIGCSPSTIRLWEAGGLPTYRYMERIAALLGVDSVDKMQKRWAKWRAEMVREAPSAAA